MSPSAFDGNTKLSKVLAAVPEALEYIVSLNPHDFMRLRNPIMRKYMTPRIALRRVAAMAQIPTAQLVDQLNALAGNTSPTSQQSADKPPQSPTAPPAWLTPDVVPRVIDVLDIDDAAGDPMPPIIAAIRRLQPGDVGLLKHRWEPQPLYDIWHKLGLEWFAQRVAPLEWHVYVHRPPDKAADAVSGRILVMLDHLNPDEVAPRCAAIFDQLAAGEHLEIVASTKVLLERSVAHIKEKYPGHFRIAPASRTDHKMCYEVYRT